MNVAILGVEQTSQGVAYVIENGYNVLLKRQHAEPLNVVAFITRGGGICLSSATRRF